MDRNGCGERDAQQYGDNRCEDARLDTHHDENPPDDARAAACYNRTIAFQHFQHTAVFLTGGSCVAGTWAYGAGAAITRAPW